MKKRLRIISLLTISLFSCGEGSKATPAIADEKPPELPEKVGSQKPLAQFDEQFIDTEYRYTDSAEQSIIIQNSLPKGGQRYTDPTGNTFVYAVFWTHIANETANPVEVTLSFPADSLVLPSSANTYVKFRIPSDAMTPDKQSMFNYGLTDLATVLEDASNTASSLRKSIDPHASYAFYVVTLFNRGVAGTVRASLSIKEQGLFYTINDMEIHCGQLNSFTVKNN